MRHIALLLLVFSFGASAQATTLATIVRGAGTGADKAAGFVSYYLRYFLSEDGRYDVVDVASALGDSEAAQKAFTEADELMSKAQSAYETLDLDPALEYLTTALSKYEKNAAYVTDIRKVADTLMLLGAVHILRGEEKTGAARLSQALSIYPAAEPDPRFFNPSMRQVFQKAANQLAARPKAALSFTSNPSYAEVYVDGIFRGVTPTAVEKVSEGKHYVRIVKDGYKGFGDVAGTVGGREIAVNGTLRPHKKLDELDKLLVRAFGELSAREGNEEQKADAAKDIGRLLNVDHVFLAEARLDGERVKVIAGQFDVKADKRLKRATHSFAYDTRLEVYEREMSDLLRTEFGETTLVKKVEEPKRPVEIVVTTPQPMGLQTIALIGGVGAGVVLGGLGAVFGVLASNDHESYKASVQNSDEAAALKSSGKTKALLADIFVTIGVLAAAGGAGMYLFWEPHSDATIAGSSDTSRIGISALPLPGGGAFFTEVSF